MLGTLSKQEAEEVLQNNLTGRIGCYSGSKVYVVPVSYVFDGTSIIAHSREGMKIQFMRSHPDVCFEVESIQDLTNWKSVIAWGRYEELQDDVERFNALQLLVNRTLKLKISKTATAPHMTAKRVHAHQPGSVKAVVFKIHLTEITGRFEKD